MKIKEVKECITVDMKLKDMERTWSDYESVGFTTDEAINTLAW